MHSRRPHNKNWSPDIAAHSVRKEDSTCKDFITIHVHMYIFITGELIIAHHHGLLEDNKMK